MKHTHAITISMVFFLLSVFLYINYFSMKALPIPHKNQIITSDSATPIPLKNQIITSDSATPIPLKNQIITSDFVKDSSDNLPNTNSPTFLSNPNLDTVSPTFLSNPNLDTVSPYHLPLRQLLQGCAEICLTDKKGTPSLFFNYIEKKVDCNSLMQNEAIDASMKSPTPSAQIPTYLLEYYTYNGQVPVSFYPGNPLNQRYLDNSAFDNQWTFEKIENMRLECKDETLHGSYGVLETNHAKHALKVMGVQDKHILVIGSERPWLEACLLSLGAKHVTTIEYGAITSTHPQVSTFTPSEIRKNYTNFFERFDAAATYSSIEHSGLGRYGDSMNPWGDRQTMARVWCMVKQNGGLMIGLPMPGDSIEYNAHRNYGPLQLSHLLANWKQIWRHPVRDNVHNVPMVLSKENFNK